MKDLIGSKVSTEYGRGIIVAELKDGRYVVEFDEGGAEFLFRKEFTLITNMPLAVGKSSGSVGTWSQSKRIDSLQRC